MHRFGGYQANCTFLIDRLDLLQQFGAIAAGKTHQREIQRRQRLVASLIPRKTIRVATDVWERKLTETGYVLHSGNCYGSSSVGRSPWTARDAFVPLLEAGRRRQCASHTKRCETVPT